MHTHRKPNTSKVDPHAYTLEPRNTRACTGADMEVLSHSDSQLTRQKWCSWTCNDLQRHAHGAQCGVPTTVASSGHAAAPTMPAFVAPACSVKWWLGRKPPTCGIAQSSPTNLACTAAPPRVRLVMRSRAQRAPCMAPCRSLLATPRLPCRPHYPRPPLDARLARTSGAERPLRRIAPPPPAPLSPRGRRRLAPLRAPPSLGSLPAP
jgi:hypothetical protein